MSQFSPTTVYNWPTVSSSSSGTEIAFDWNGLPQKVTYFGTNTQNNSCPLPANPIDVITGNYITPASQQDLASVITNLANISGQLPPALGSRSSSQSISVVLANDATSAPISFFKNSVATGVSQDTVTPANSIPLPTALLNTNGTVFDTSIFTTILNKIPALGQATMAASLPVVIASNQSTLPISAASLPLPTGAATYAAQTDGTQKGQIVDGGTGLSATVHNLSSTIVNGDKGLVTQAVMHAKNGSSFYDVACDASGVLSANVLSSVLPTGAATETTLNSIYSLENYVATSGTVTPGIPLVIDVLNRGSLSFTTSGTWTGTVLMLVSDDNVTYTNIFAYDPGIKDSFNSFITNSTGSVNCAGYRYIKFFGVTTGTLTVNYVLSRLTNNTFIAGSLPTGNNKIGNVDINTSLPAGSNNIGSVNVAALPATAATNASDGSSTGGTAGTKSSLAGGIYNSSAPTLTTGQQAGLQLDSSGNLKTTSVVAANANGSYAEITNLTTVAQTFTVPANAVGFILEALSDNTANIRYKIGATATTTSGMRMESGRDSGYVPCAANISVIAESGTNQVVTVQWILK